jgi:hypothetical protein
MFASFDSFRRKALFTNVEEMMSAKSGSTPMRSKGLKEQGRAYIRSIQSKDVITQEWGRDDWQTASSKRAG